MADLYMGKYTKTSTALIKILGPAIGVIKDKTVVRQERIVFDGQTGDLVIYENCKKLFKRIGQAYWNWNELDPKNFNDLGGKDKSIRFRVTDDGFIANTNANAKNDYGSHVLFKPLQFYIEELQPLKEKYDEINLLGKVLRAFRNMPNGEPNQVTGRHPLEVSMYVWAAIYHDWLNFGSPQEKDWFIDMFVEFFENENLSLVLYKCFRGAPTSNEQLLQMVEQEYISHIMSRSSLGVPPRGSSKNVSYVGAEVEEESEEEEISLPRRSARQPRQKRNHSSSGEDEPGKPSTKKCREVSESSSDETPTIQQSKWYYIATDDRYSDVLLIASNGFEIKFHRSVLSKYSNAFAKIFQESKEFPVRISIKDFDQEIIKTALNFMLEKPYRIVGKENSLLKFAVQYEILDLIKACSDHANKFTPTKANVIEYVQLAYTYNLEELKQNCLKFLSENKKEINKAVLNGLPQNIVVDAFYF